MKHPDFKHRAMPDGGDYEEYSEADLLIFVDNSIEHIQDMIDLMSQQYQPNQEDIVLIPDATNLSTLKQLTLSVLDLQVMVEWFLNKPEVEHQPVPAKKNKGKSDKTLN